MSPKIESKTQDDGSHMTELKVLLSATSYNIAEPLRSSSTVTTTNEKETKFTSVNKVTTTTEKKIVRFAEPGTPAKRSAKAAAKLELQMKRCVGR